MQVLCAADASKQNDSAKRWVLLSIPGIGLPFVFLENVSPLIPKASSGMVRVSDKVRLQKGLKINGNQYPVLTKTKIKEKTCGGLLLAKIS